MRACHSRPAGRRVGLCRRGRGPPRELQPPCAPVLTSPAQFHTRFVPKRGGQATAASKADRKADPNPPRPQDTKASNAHAAKANSDKTSSKLFPDAVSNLLWNASTLISARGEASCNVCHREGFVTCPECGGQRVVSSTGEFTTAKAHAQARLSRVLPGAKAIRASKGGEGWRVSNRCPSCRGAGVIECPACSGAGVRTAQVNAASREDQE
jgi:hypothetical protein